MWRSIFAITLSFHHLIKSFTKFIESLVHCESDWNFWKIELEVNILNIAIVFNSIIFNHLIQKHSESIPSAS